MARAAWEVGADSADSGGIFSEEPLRTLVEIATAAWLEIEIPPARFNAYLQERLKSEDEIRQAAPHAPDLYLACACLEGVARALRVLDDRYLGGVARFVARIGVEVDFVDEVKQILRERLLVAHPPNPPRLASYGGHAPLASWIAVCAQRVALDHRKKRHGREVLEPEPPSAPSTVGDPELTYLKLRYQPIFEGAVSTVLERMLPRERVLLRMWLYQRLSMEVIAGVYKVNTSTISRWLLKARERLATDVELLLRDKLGLTEPEFESLSRLVRSQMDATVLRGLECS